MFDLLLPKHVRQGRNLLKDATKMLAYKRDLWSDATVLEYKSRLRRLEEAVRQRDASGIEENGKELDRICAENLPPAKDAAMRENVEVFLVAIVIALGVRTYFLQPFTIPTGSMQPTLNGVIGYRTTEPPPNALKQVVDYAVHGRDWIDVVAVEGEEVIGVDEYKTMGFGTRFGLFTRTEIKTTKGGHTVPGMRETIVRYFLENPGRVYKAGESIARGYIETGDHVFVDKMTYHFRKPQHAEVFVFNTQHIPTNENRVHPDGPSQFYIKRLGGVPGDELRIDPPRLFQNGKEASDPRYCRVMEMKEPGYRGYSNGPEGGPRFGILGNPDIPFTVPPKNYFALGDNSFHSSDSRDWGPVPEQNIMGRGVIAYWPFGAHWGLIH